LVAPLGDYSLYFVYKGKNYMDKRKFASILLVDDDDGVRKATTSLLNSYGYRVTAFSNADDAFGILQTDNFDVVITDIVMPHISGIDFLKKVHDNDPQIPVILMTAYADMEKMIDAIKIGAFDFIIKPVNIELFIHSVEKAVHYTRTAQLEEDYKHLLEEYNQEIESLISERTMSLMALTVADKIRNPATVIGLICKRLRDKETDPDKVKSKLDEIISETEKLDRIVNNFETLLQSKKYTFRHENVDGHLENIISVNKDHAAAKGIEMIFNPCTEPLRAHIQKNLFQIALSHIIKNSIEATPEGGTITVSTNKNDEHVILTISDTGSGITKEEIDKIFDPMFSTKDQKFGMGLSLVKQIVSEHMGKINVASNPAHGTTFTITLPIRWTENQS
jgi:signal transduction histidine kinase